MGELNINLTKTKQIADNIHFLGNDFSDYSDRMGTVSNELKKNNSISINSLCDKIDFQNQEILKAAKTMDSLFHSLNSIISKYIETEKRISECEFGTITSGNIMEPSSGTSDPAPTSGLVSDIENLKKEIEKLKKILKGLAKGTDSSEVKVLEKILTYFESLLNFFLGDKKGLTGASDLCSLTDSSINLWQKLYDYYQKQYNNMENGLFGKIAQRDVKIVGLVSGFFAFTASILSASSGLSDKEWQDIVADYVKSGKDIVTIIESGYSLKHLSDAQSLSKIKAGPWSALDIYTALGYSAVQMLSQGIRSYGKYSSDGQWTAYDTGATGIDVAMAGIYGLAHKLTGGWDDLIYEMVENLTGGNKHPDMGYAQQAAEGYKIMANTIGTALGNWWNNLKK